MDKQDKIWDDVLGFLAWKFDKTESGEMAIDFDEVAPELKSKYVIKTFESFMNEGGLGALSIIDDAPRLNPIIPPDINTPLNVPMNFGGSRIPSHWNNAPFMSGQYGPGGGSSLAGFGSNPQEKEEELERFTLLDVRKYKYKKYDSQDALRADYEALDKLESRYSEMYTSIKEDRFRNMRGVINEFNSFMNLYEAAVNNLGMEPTSLIKEDFNLSIDYEVDEEPTEGTSSTYDHPGDPGDPGSYSFFIEPSDTTRRELMEIGFTEEDAKGLEYLDLDDVSVFNGADMGMMELAAPMYEVIMKIEQGLSEAREEFDDSSSRRELNLYEDFSIEDPEDVIAIKYLLGGTLYRNSDHSSAYSSRAFVRKAKRELNRKLTRLKRNPEYRA